jgi:hypothetical protein
VTRSGAPTESVVTACGGGTSWARAGVAAKKQLIATAKAHTADR